LLNYGETAQRYKYHIHHLHVSRSAAQQSWSKLKTCNKVVCHY